MTEDGSEQLMNALISKMESMDRNIQEVRAENAVLRKAFANPKKILRKAGFVQYNTPLAEDVEVDAFRNDMTTTEIMKGGAVESTDPDKFSNEEIHEMSWGEIHSMADQHREVKEMY